jgi:hypothetical protein
MVLSPSGRRADPRDHPICARRGPSSEPGPNAILDKILGRRKTQLRTQLEMPKRADRAVGSFHSRLFV